MQETSQRAAILAALFHLAQARPARTVLRPCGADYVRSQRADISSGIYRRGLSFFPIRLEVRAVVHERPCYRPLSGFAGRAAFQRAGEVGEGFPQPSLSC